MSQVALIFKVKWQEFNLRRFVIFAIILGLLIVVGVLPDDRRYFLSAIFGALFVSLSDPGGKYGPRVGKMAAMAVAGALLTALAFGIGAGPWGWVVLAAFAVTLLSGLAVKYGAHRFIAAYLLNVWFIVALSLPTLLSFHLPGPDSSGLVRPWQQALAWLVGSALWVAVTFIGWLALGRKAVPQPVAEIPGDISPRPLTRPLVLFAVLRGIAVAIAVAISFGLKLPDADWMPIAAIIAMKPSLQQSVLIAEQRVAGTIVGAGVAVLVLLPVANLTALEVIVVVLLALAASIRTMNYAFYTAALAAAVLIIADVPDPSNLSHEGRRILFTLAGVGIAIIVLVLAGLLQKRIAKRVE